MNEQIRIGARLARQRSLAVAIALAGSMSPVAIAQDAAPKAPTAAVVDDLLDRLDDSSFAVREQASEALRGLYEAGSLSLIRGMAGIRDQAYFDMFAGRELSPEQEARILEVARDAFFSSERAGVGMQWQQAGPGADGRTETRGLAITLTVAGFPCHDLGRLAVGDVVTGVCGQSLDADSLLDLQQQGQDDIVRAHILSHDPGEVITMLVIPHDRAKDPDAEPVERQIPLGLFSGLNNTRPPGDQTLELAWRLRLERMGFERPADTRLVLPTKVSADNWLEHADRPLDDAPRSLIIGHADQMWASDIRSGARVNAQVIQADGAQGLGRLLMQQLRQNMGHRNRAVANLDAVRATIATLRLRLENGGSNMPIQERQRVEEELSSQQAQEARLVDRIEAWTTQIKQTQAQIDALMRDPNRLRQP